MEEKVVKANSPDLKFIYTSLFVCVVIPLVMSLIIGHISGYYEGFSFLGLNFSIPNTLFTVLTPVMFGVLGLGLHFVVISAKSTEANFRLSLSLWTATFLFALSWLIIFFSTHFLVLAFVWIAITLSLSIMLTIINFKMNLISAICSMLFSGWLAVIAYVLTMSLVA